MEEKYEHVKESEFNSNVACLMRIDTLIKTLHDSALGIFQNGHVNQRLAYCKTLLRLHKEGMVKFTKQEKADCLKYKEKLRAFNLYSVADKIVVSNVMYNIADEFEDKLMTYLDAHNMLMSNKSEIDDSPSSVWIDDTEEDIKEE